MAEAASAAGLAEPEEEAGSEDVGETAAGSLARLAGAAALLDGLAEGTPESAASPVETPGAAGSMDEAANAEASQDLTLAGLATEAATEDVTPATPQADTAPAALDDDAEPAPTVVIPESERTS